MYGITKSSVTSRAFQSSNPAMLVEIIEEKKNTYKVRVLHSAGSYRDHLTTFKKDDMHAMYESEEDARHMFEQYLIELAEHNARVKELEYEITRCNTTINTRWS